MASGDPGHGKTAEGQDADNGIDAGRPGENNEKKVTNRDIARNGDTQSELACSTWPPSGGLFYVSIILVVATTLVMVACVVIGCPRDRRE